MLKIVIDEVSCDKCQDCLSACDGELFKYENDKIVINDQNICHEVKNCLSACPSDALKISGKDERVDYDYCCEGDECEMNYSELFNWPIKLRYINEQKLNLDNKHLVLVADCASFVHGRFNETFLNDKFLITFCERDLDTMQLDKLERIVTKFKLKSLEVILVGVNCCEKGRGRFIELAKANQLPFKQTLITTDGMLIKEKS